MFACSALGNEGENKELFRILFYLICLSISNMAAFLASLRLQRISDYRELYEASKSFLKIFPITPYVHRSHLFELVNEKNAKELEKVGRKRSRSRSPDSVAAHRSAPAIIARQPVSDLFHRRSLHTSLIQNGYGFAACLSTFEKISRMLHSQRHSHIRIRSLMEKMMMMRMGLQCITYILSSIFK